MKRPLKKWLLGAVSLGFLVMAALLVMPRFIDLNRYKAYLEKRLSTMTGYPVTLGGKIDLSLFPWVGFAFTDLHIGNPDGFAEKDFVSAEAIEMRVKLIPLLSGDLEVKRFVVDSPRIVLVKNRGGRGNWERLGRKSALRLQGLRRTGPHPPPPTADRSRPCRNLPFERVAPVAGRQKAAPAVKFPS